MRALPPSIAALVAGLGLAAGACSSSGASCPADAGAAGDGARAGDATASTESDGGGASPVMDAATPQPVTGLRVANWSPDSPAVDFCLSPHGAAAFQGPLLRGLAAQEVEAGVEAGCPTPLPLAFPEVSSYSFVVPDQYDVRVVVAGASDCSVGITSDATNLPPLARGTFNTLALVGEANPVGAGAGLEIVAFEDAAAAAPGVAVRFINAAANVPAASFGSLLTGGSVVEVFTNVQFGQAGTINGQTPDAGEETPAQTYAPLLSPSGLTFVASLSSGTPGTLATANNVTIAAGAVVTMALVGPTAIDGGVGVELLECIDNAGTVGLCGNCQIVSR